MQLTEGIRFAFEQGCVNGGSWCTKENNAWARSLWKELYLAGSSNDDDGRPTSRREASK